MIVDRTLNQSINQLLNQSIHPYTQPSINKSVSQSINQSTTDVAQADADEYPNSKHTHNDTLLTQLDQCQQRSVDSQRQLNR